MPSNLFFGGHVIKSIEVRCGRNTRARDVTSADRFSKIAKEHDVQAKVEATNSDNDHMDRLRIQISATIE
jgi:hypothetical protein